MRCKRRRGGKRIALRCKVTTLDQSRWKPTQRRCSAASRNRVAVAAKPEIDQNLYVSRYCTSFAELGRMDVRVSSWSELQDAVFAGSWREEINRFRSGFVFRGA